MDHRDALLDEYEEPALLGADDLEDVYGGCIASCSNGDCSSQAKFGSN